MFENLVQQLLILKIGDVQVYLLWFLLGSFTVATLSDLKYLSAQKEFLQVWVVFILTMFVTDLYYNCYLIQNTTYLVLKWGLIFVFLPFYFHYIHRVAWGDIFAKMAACSLLSPLFIIGFIILVKIIDRLTKYLWLRWGRNNLYPFMPVIFFTTLILIIASAFLK